MDNLYGSGKPYYVILTPKPDIRVEIKDLFIGETDIAPAFRQFMFPQKIHPKLP